MLVPVKNDKNTANKDQIGGCKPSVDGLQSEGLGQLLHGESMVKRQKFEKCQRTTNSLRYDGCVIMYGKVDGWF